MRLTCCEPALKCKRSRGPRISIITRPESWTRWQLRISLLAQFLLTLVYVLQQNLRQNGNESCMYTPIVVYARDTNVMSRSSNVSLLYDDHDSSALKLCIAVLSGDTLILRGRVGQQGQPAKERCASIILFTFIFLGYLMSCYQRVASCGHLGSSFGNYHQRR